jgi:hypothetical protein
MANNIVQISVGSDGTRWCRDSLGKLYKMEGGQWRQNPAGIAAHIAVGDANNVWCHNNAGELFKLTGSAYDSAWEKDQVGKNVTSLSVTPAGTVYVTNNKGEIWERTASGEWSQIPAPLPPLQPKRTHIVKRGEHLLQIIRNTYPGISEADALKKADEVAKLNGWPSRDQILYPGQEIILEA